MVGVGRGRARGTGLLGLAAAYDPLHVVWLALARSKLLLYLGAVGEDLLIGPSKKLVGHEVDVALHISLQDEVVKFAHLF